MKNMFSILLLVSFVSLNAIAGGSIIGSGGSSMEALIRGGPVNTIMPMERKPVQQGPNQVYYMRQKQAEIEFATTTQGANKVDIQSLRPEEITNPAVVEGLRRSQQTRQWENIKMPTQSELNRGLQNFNMRW